MSGGAQPGARLGAERVVALVADGPEPERELVLRRRSQVCQRALLAISWGNKQTSPRVGELVNWSAGVDCSTQATKVLVVDPDDGRVVASGRAPHEVTGTGGARETDPAVWWEALGAALAETGRAGEVGAISVAGQQHGLVVTDADGPAAAPGGALERHALGARRAAPARRAGRRGLGRARRRGAGALVHRHALGLAAAHRARRRPRPARDPAPARLAHRAALRPRRDRPRRRLRHRLVVDPRRGLRGRGARAGRRSTARCCPTCSGRASAAGEVVAGRRWGCRRAPSSGPGTGDNMGAALGLGLRPGEPAISLGTSGTAYAAMSERAVDPSGLIAGFADAAGGFLPLAATLNCTLAVDRVADWLGLEREAVAERDRGDRAALPRRRAHAQPAARGRHDRRPAPRHRARPDPAGRLRGRGRLAGGGARAARPRSARASTRTRRSC